MVCSPFQILFIDNTETKRQNRSFLFFTTAIPLHRGPDQAIAVKTALALEYIAKMAYLNKTLDQSAPSPEWNQSGAS